MMKKYFMMMMVCCLGHTLVCQADTDISGIDNVIYLEPVSVPAGSQQVLSVKMKNTVSVQGFGFDLYLPEGMEFATDENGDPVVALSTERTTTRKTDTFMSTIQANGSLRVFGTSLGGYTIDGNDGEIALVTINVSASMVQGDYLLTLKEVTVTDNNAIGYDTDLVESTITVTEALDPWTTLDENATSVPAATSGDVDIKVKRTIKANEWSTLVLPFDMTEAQVKAAFGSDVRLAEFVSYDVNEDATEIAVLFDDADLSGGFLANYPYLIKTSQDIDEFTVTATIAPDEENAVAEYAEGRGARRHVYGTFVGTLHAGTTVPDQCLFLNANNFWYSTGSTQMKAFRAYFSFEDVLSTDGGSAKVSIVMNETTGIDAVHRSQFIVHSDVPMYNLAGQKVNAQYKGVVIQNGVKKIQK